MEDERGIFLLGIGVLILLLIFLVVCIVKKRHKGMKERKAASMKSSDAKQQALQQEIDENNNMVKWTFSKKHKRSFDGKNSGNKEFEKVRENISFDNKSGLMSFHNMTSLQLDTEKGNEDQDATPENKIVLNLEDVNLGYVETHENMTDREVQKFAIEFSRSNVLDLDSTKRLDFRPEKDSASLSESSSDEENQKKVEQKTKNVLKGINFS